MGIEWTKIQGKQDKDYKVKGTVLLEMKGKIETMEKEIASLTGKIEGMRLTVETTTGEKDKNIKNLVDEKNKVQSSLEGKATSLESKISQLELKNRELASSLEATKEEARKKAAGAEDIRKERDELKKKIDSLDLELQSRDFDSFKKYIKEKSSRASKSFEQKPGA
jgi:chromosome segregation ATPase